MTNKEFMEALNDLKEANEYLQSLREEFKNQPDLLNFYEPSAKEIVKQFHARLSLLLSTDLDMNLLYNRNEANHDNSVDIWVHLEGAEFHQGKGPIGIVGTYLQRLNNASKHAINLVAQTKQGYAVIKSKLASLACFDLAATAQGSLKLGLKLHDVDEKFHEHEDFQQLYFSWEETPSQKHQEESRDEIDFNELALEGFDLLAKTVASAQDNKLFNELRKKYSDKSMLKLLHYAKELVPSSRSTIEYISFESNKLSFPTNHIKLDKQVRKLLTHRARSFRNNTTFVEGNGWLRAIDTDHHTVVIRPFNYSTGELTQIECRFPYDEFQSEQVASFLDKFVNISGFLIFNQNNSPVRLEVDSISIQEKADVE
ncbi:hypothetical protein [Aneurinibacillus migulanus]|uniref:hypothetical protein n=1 Tax=Aneurinibacillus migulanus TaxID=47500 RepID=UPI00209F130F|nr:hypothetical protein [Aneurinibacillus migulanus]MCP1355527.1 hypothetical protein [Aneurinibacillus migulanus]